jgi:2-polyprenyl-3-methyl-5-hydroxy-6-metoxy-1,4-benzoquinol methylase
MSAVPDCGDASDRIRQGYYEMSRYFEAGRHLTDPNSRFQRYRAREVLRLCGPLDGIRAVDLGCGWGTISFALARSVESVVGVDFAEASVRFCSLRHGSDWLSNLSFVQADARQTGLKPRVWDLVVAADLVEHLYPADTLDVYRESLRLLRPGGRLVVWTPSPTHFLERLRRWGLLKPDPTHVDYKTLARTRSELENCGFRVHQARYVPSHLPGIRTLERIGQRWIGSLQRRVAIVAIKPESLRAHPQQERRGSH